MTDLGFDLVDLHVEHPDDFDRERVNVWRAVAESPDVLASEGFAFLRRQFSGP